MKTVRFRDWDCVVEKRHYGNGRPALVLNDTQDGEQVAVATVNLPEMPSAPNHVFLKDYSENKGMLQALTEAGVVRDTGIRVQSGFVEIPVTELQGPYREPEKARDPWDAHLDNKPYDPSDAARSHREADKDRGRGR